jgi:hypothetical protein
VAIAKDVRASHQIDKEEECPGDSKRRKNGGIDKCQHDFQYCPLLHFFLKLRKQDISQNFDLVSAIARAANNCPAKKTSAI